MQGRSDLFEVVLEENDLVNHKTISKENLEQFLKNSDNIRFWAFILHDKDLNEDGVKKRNHYHLVIKFYSPYAKSTVINSIAKEMFINKDIIGCQIARSLVNITRYLTHIDSPNKQLYSLNLVCSSNNEELNEIYNGTDIFLLDTVSLLNILEKCDTLAQVYCAIGIKNAVRYRGVINDLWRDIQGKKMRNSLVDD